MKRNLLIIVVAVLLLAGWTFQGKPALEYKVVFSPTEKKINETASQGWELVAIDTYQNYVFKRAK